MGYLCSVLTTLKGDFSPLTSPPVHTSHSLDVSLGFFSSMEERSFDAYEGTLSLLMFRVAFPNSMEYRIVGAFAAPL